LGDDDESDAPDVVHGADPSDDDGDESAAARTKRRLLAFAKEADALAGNADEKLVRATKLIQGLLDDGFNPIVFCRFIPTAEYLAEHLRTRLKRGVEVVAVTGTITAPEREARIAALAEHPKRVLVATDCLSEGINLQHAFDAVLHYDLPWNPTRLEQREGRVDRFGQEAPEVRVVTYHGDDNQIDEIVLDVLLRKHRIIRNTLGVSIPVPGSASTVIEALTEGVLLAEGTGGIADRLPGMEDFFKPSAEQLAIEWDAAADKEKASRSLFAQAGIQVAEVAREVAEVQAAVGAGAEVEDFVRTTVAAHGGRASVGTPTEIDLAETPLGLKEAVGPPEQFRASFDAGAEGERYLARTDPFVAGLASFVLDRALDGASDAVARRCGLVRTAAVSTRTTLVLVRYRFHLVTTKGGVETPLLAEDSGLIAWTGPPEQPAWLSHDDVLALLAAEPAANPGGAIDFLTEAVAALDQIAPHLEDEARRRAERLHDAHTRVREAARQKGVQVRVEPQLPVDVLGVYVYLPAPAGATR
ncbi:MAG TPA: helicase-related protein, partial [Acidimicrobiales bacterium]